MTTQIHAIDIPPATPPLWLVAAYSLKRKHWFAWGTPSLRCTLKSRPFVTRWEAERFAESLPSEWVHRTVVDIEPKPIGIPAQ